MLVRFYDGCKLLAWGAAAGSCLVAAVISHRAPHSIWNNGLESPSFNAAVRREMSALQPISWNEGRAGDQDNFSQPIAGADPLIAQNFSALPQALPPKPLSLIPPQNSPATHNLASEFEPEIPAISQESSCPSACPNEQFTTDSALFDDSPYVINEQSEATVAIESAQTIAPCYTTSDGGSRLVCAIEKLETDEATEVTNRQVTMRDAATNQPVATLTIAGMIESAELPEEAIELAAAERLQNRAAYRTYGSSHHRENFVNAYRDQTSGHFTIDAQTIEISELATQISQRFGLPIICHDSAVGTVSASVTEVTLICAVRRLVEPFGFAVVEYGPQIVIGDLEALEYEARVEAAASEAQMIADREAAERAAIELAAAEAAAMEAAARAAEEAARNAVANSEAQRLPPVGQVSAASHLAPPIKKHQASAEEIAIGKQAKAMVAEGQLTETIDMLTDAIQDYPNSPMMYRMLSEIYYHRNDLRAAEKAAKRSLAIDKLNPLTNKIYGDVLAKLGQTNRSQHYLRQAKHLNFSN